MYCSIVLYHHTYQDIQKTLNSLLGTTNCQNIILVDNGGCEWANYLDNSKIIYLKSPKNGGFGYGHNLAIKQYAKYSDFFLICNPACSGCFMLFCSMALLKLGGLDERYFMYLE